MRLGARSVTEFTDLEIAEALYAELRDLFHEQQHPSGTLRPYYLLGLLEAGVTEQLRRLRRRGEH